MRLRTDELWFKGLPDIMRFCAAGDHERSLSHLTRPFRVPQGIATTDGKIVAILRGAEGNGHSDCAVAHAHIAATIDDLAAMVYEPLKFPEWGMIPVSEPCDFCSGYGSLPPVPVEVAAGSFFDHRYLQRLRNAPDIGEIGLSISQRDLHGVTATTLRFTFANGAGFGFLAGMGGDVSKRPGTWRIGNAATFIHPDRT